MKVKTQEDNPFLQGLMKALKQRGCQCEHRPESDDDFESLDVKHNTHYLEMWFNSDLGPETLIMKTVDRNERSHGAVRFVNLQLPRTDPLKISLDWLLRGKRP